MYNFTKLYRDMKTFEATSKINQRLKRFQHLYALRAQRVVQQYIKSIYHKQTKQK